MVGLRRIVSASVLALLSIVTSCGGESFKDGGEAGDAGDPGAGSGNSAGSNGGDLNAAGVSGTASAGGATGTGGSSTGSGGVTSGSGGSGNCDEREAEPCPEPICPDGEVVTPKCGCPTCSCENVACVAVDCPPDSVAVREPGACCDTCVPVDSRCDQVTCQAPTACGDGASWRRQPGACCAACAPDPGTTWGCVDILCPTLECPLGYAPGTPDNGGCCYECMPDPLFCLSDEECVVATRSGGSCCCPQVTSLQRYEEEDCWFAGPDGRPNGDNCPSCGLACPCAYPGEPFCVQNHCSAVIPL